MAGQPLTLFTLASGRSGTSFLADFFAQNIEHCYSTHEPYFTAGNPTLFGKPVEWNTLHNDSALLSVLERKMRFIHRRPQAFYFEANHAFLKAFNRHAGNLLENPGFIHLVRNPLLVAKSELLREQAIRKARIPFVDYTGTAGQPLFRWALTGNETIFRHYPHSYSRFQFYVLQWLEIEHRAMQLVADNHWQNRVFFIDVDVNLKEPQVLKSMAKFFDLPHKPEFNMDLRRNQTPFVGPTTIGEQDRQEFCEVMQRLPASYRQLFETEPYCDCSWYDEVSHIITGL
jgi:hypothetical protein